MATPYSEVYAFFTGKISDFDFVNLTDTEIDDTIHPYLQISTTRFKGCRNDLTMDDVNSQFTSTLTIEEQNILACYMVIEWLRPVINSTSVLKLALTDRDFQMSSQGNHLAQLTKLRKDTEYEVKSLVRDYTYDNPQGLKNLVTTETYSVPLDYGVLSPDGGNTDEGIG